MIRVVIADDQAMVREGFAALLDAQPDVEVVATAEHGLAAVEAVRGREAAGEPVDVVLMDVRMPVLDGLEATRRLLGAGDPVGDADGDPTGARRPRVLVLTTFDLDDYVYEALCAGASGFLLKDAPAADLVAAVRVVAGGDALLAPSVTRRLIADFAAARPRDPAHRPAALERLTPREVEVLALVARGLSNAEIAADLVVAEETVKTHVSRMLTKLRLRDRAQAVVVAYETGLVRPGVP